MEKTKDGIVSAFKSARIKLNPNMEEVEGIKTALKENGGYCPCRMTKSEDTKCMCKEFREQKEDGYCHCGLYYKEF